MKKKLTDMKMARIASIFLNGFEDVPNLGNHVESDDGFSCLSSRSSSPSSLVEDFDVKSWSSDSSRTSPVPADADDKQMISHHHQQFINLLDMLGNAKVVPDTEHKSIVDRLLSAGISCEKELRDCIVLHPKILEELGIQLGQRLSILRYLKLELALASDPVPAPAPAPMIWYQTRNPDMQTMFRYGFIYTCKSKSIMVDPKIFDPSAQIVSNNTNTQTQEPRHKKVLQYTDPRIGNSMSCASADYKISCIAALYGKLSIHKQKHGVESEETLKKIARYLYELHVSQRPLIKMLFHDTDKNLISCIVEECF